METVWHSNVKANAFCATFEWSKRETTYIYYTTTNTTGMEWGKSEDWVEDNILQLNCSISFIRNWMRALFFLFMCVCVVCCRCWHLYMWVASIPKHFRNALVKEMWSASYYYAAYLSTCCFEVRSTKMHGKSTMAIRLIWPKLDEICNFYFLFIKFEWSHFKENRRCMTAGKKFEIIYC